MNKIRTSIFSATVVGGSILGLVGVGGGTTQAAVDTDPAPVSTDDTATPTTTATPTADAPAPGAGDSDARDSEACKADREAPREVHGEAHRAEVEADHQEIADVLGVTTDDLREQLDGGATLAEVAEANGVAVSDVVDVIVTQMTERLDQEVVDGRLTADEAAERAADLDEQAQTRVEAGRPEGPGGPGGHGPAEDRGPHREGRDRGPRREGASEPGRDVPAAEPAAETTTTGVATDAATDAES